MVWIPCTKKEKTESYVEVFCTLNLPKQEKIVMLYPTQIKMLGNPRALF